MITELFQWELLKAIEAVTKNQTTLSLNLTTSSVLFSIYLLTFKRTRLLGLSFFACEVSGFMNGFGLYESEAHLYIGYLLIFCYFAKIQITALKDEFSKFCRVSFCSLALIILFAYASYDAYNYPKTKTAFYLAYPDLLLFIHVCIVLSFYDIERILITVGDKFRRFVGMLCSNYTVKYFCYTLSYRFKSRAS